MQWSTSRGRTNILAQVALETEKVLLPGCQMLQIKTHVFASQGDGLLSIDGYSRLLSNINSVLAVVSHLQNCVAAVFTRNVFPVAF